MANDRTALVVSNTDIQRDPRVRRQIDWLSRDGWVVDTLGLGGAPSGSVRTHTSLRDPTSFAQTRIGAALPFVLPHRVAFLMMFERRVPPRLLRGISAGDYDLLVLNELDFAPWLGSPRLSQTSQPTLVHLDLHEFHETRRGKGLWSQLTRRYHRWARQFLAHPRATSRSTVAKRIAELYAEEFGIAEPVLVRNIPPYEDIAPSEVDPQRIGLVFHGLASRGRGLSQILDAVPALDDRFSVTFMLMPNRDVIPELSARIAAGWSDRVRIVPPAPMHELARTVNAYDLEVMFYPPISTNVELALPNKLFEAIQGRLALVIGDSPMMREVVEEWGNGIVISGWTNRDLARGLNGLSANDIRRMKAASDKASRRLNAENEGHAFIEAVRRGSRPQH